MPSNGWSHKTSVAMSLTELINYLQIKKMKPDTSYRVDAVDIMRGLTLFLMLFVNDLYEPGVPHWLVHERGNVDAMGLADWVFPGFLFMVGLAIPFAMAARQKRGATKPQLLGHILLRTASLLVIGVLILNGEERLNAALTGMNRLLWLFLLYTCIFLVWNQYPKYAELDSDPACARPPHGPFYNRSLLFLLLRLLGIAGLVWLCWIFKAGKPGAERWLRPGWWGILGLIGWGYLVAALSYLFAGKKTGYILLLWCFFVFLNIWTDTGKLAFLEDDSLLQLLGVVTDGNVPAIVLSGLFVGTLLWQRRFPPEKLVFLLVLLGLACIGSGLLLRHWFIISKIIGTPSWAMLCCGISMLVFALIYTVTELGGYRRWAGLFRLAGRNSLTTYLAPDMLYFLSWYFGWHLFFYKQDQHAWLAILGSLVWAILMVLYARLLSRCAVRLKL